jgi:hypothetical protein
MRLDIMLRGILGEGLGLDLMVIGIRAHDDDTILTTEIRRGEFSFSCL